MQVAGRVALITKVHNFYVLQKLRQYFADTTYRPTSQGDRRTQGNATGDIRTR